MTLAQTTITVTDQGPEWWQLSLLLLPIYIAAVVILAALAVWWHRNRSNRPVHIGILGQEKEDLSQFPDGWEGEKVGG